MMALFWLRCGCVFAFVGGVGCCFKWFVVFWVGARLAITLVWVLVFVVSLGFALGLA